MYMLIMYVNLNVCYDSTHYEILQSVAIISPSAVMPCVHAHVSNNDINTIRSQTNVRELYMYIYMFVTCVKVYVDHIHTSTYLL